MDKKIMTFAQKGIICLFLIITTLVCGSMEIFAVEQPTETPVPSAILVDAQTNNALYEKEADIPIMPASTTKILTALLVFEAIDQGVITLDDKVETTQEIVEKTPFDASKVVPNLQPGEVMTVREYLYCLLMVSDCTACDVLAQHVSGSVDAFVARMNERAAELGCRNTNFVNTHGYPDENHYTTARSLALITSEAMKHDVFREMFGTIKLRIEKTNLSNPRMLYNSNWLIWNPDKITSIYCTHYYEYATGGKTGTSQKSGHCLVSTAQKDGRTLICVITGGKIVLDSTGTQYIYQHYYESERLFEWGFANHSNVSIVSSGDVVGKMKITGGESDSVSIEIKDNNTMLLPNDADASDVVTKIVIDESKRNAPVSAGDAVGELTASYGEDIVVTVPVYAIQNIGAETSGCQSCSFGKVVSAILIVLLVIVLLVGIALLYLLNSKYAPNVKNLYYGLLDEFKKSRLKAQKKANAPRKLN